MRLKDTSTGYGWTSIALHWVTAVVIILLLYLGNSISVEIGDARVQALNSHTSVAISFYVVLWARIVWRFVYGHPGALPRQSSVWFTLGKWTHYIILVALGVMLITGPLTAWFSGNAIVVFDWFAIPTPFDADFGVRDLSHSIHRLCAIVIFIGILLHLGGVYKHTAFNQDGTLSKIIFAERESSADKVEPEAPARH